MRTWVRLPSPPPVISQSRSKGKVFEYDASEIRKQSFFARNDWQAHFKEFYIMFYVYYLKSKSFPEKTYIGYTGNLKQRLADHNAGKSLYTKDFKPWKLIGFLGFDQEFKAIQFEKYLKTNAGRIFIRRYFLQKKR